MVINDHLAPAEGPSFRIEFVAPPPSLLILGWEELRRAPASGPGAVRT